MVIFAHVAIKGFGLLFINEIYRIDINHFDGNSELQLMQGVSNILTTVDVM